MKDLGEAGCRLIAFKTLYGPSREQFEEIIGFPAVAKIRLKKGDKLYFIDVDGDAHTVQAKNDGAKVAINGNVLIFEQTVYVQDVRL